MNLFHLNDIIDIIDQMRLSMDYHNPTLDALEDRLSAHDDLFELEQVALALENYEFPEPIDAPDFPHGEDLTW